MFTLQGKRVLIVEDCWFQAVELAAHLGRSGAKIVGPAASAASGLKLASDADIAILDVDLDGEAVFPVADALAGRGVPFVFYSAYSRSRIPPRFHFASHLAKPSTPPAIESAVHASAMNFEPRPRTVADMLPRLRLVARLLLPDPMSADRLVEETLLRAIDCGPPEHEETAEWLHRLLQEVARERGGNLLN